jgi:two-component system response regulator YesN
MDWLLGRGVGKMYRLVIVDDEVKILDGIAEIFPWHNIGFQVAARFTSARAALKYLEQERADVVMTDISMPDMDGLELTEQLKKYPDLIVVLFSSYHDYEYMRSAIKLEIMDYLLKPINYEDLLVCFENIKETLDSRMAVEEEKPLSYYEEIISRVDEYLQENYRRGNLTGAAETVGLSPNYLSKIYKEKSGIGFWESLNKIRMEKAGELLRNPEYKSYEIAYYVGYDNPKNFARAFKSYHHVSPREYRNGIRGKE